MKKYLRKFIQGIGRIAFPEEYMLSRQEREGWMVLNGKMLGLLHATNISQPKALADFEFKVFSQWGEDGIIDWLVQKLSPLPEIFIEFGVENYIESNTRFLLQNRNWRGLIIDGSDTNIETIKKSELYWRYDLTACARFITRDNIDAIIKEHGFSGEIGLLSIDIDGNDYWVWDAIQTVSPALVVCEFSSTLGDMLPVSTPYSDDFVRHKSHFSGQYAGASVAALIHLGKKKGYTFLGTTSTGVNAFFIRNDLISRIEGCAPLALSFPVRSSDTRDEKQALTFLRREQRLQLIAHLPVVNVATGEKVLISELHSLYSERWINLMRGKG